MVTQYFKTKIQIGRFTYVLLIQYWQGTFENRCTLSLKSLSGLSSVCYKTTHIAGGVRGTGATPPTSKLGTFLSRPLALSKPTYSNSQINGALGQGP